MFMKKKKKEKKEGITKRRRGPRDLESGIPSIMRKRFCRFCKDKVNYIDYKDLHILEKMINERGKMLSRRSTGNCAGHQRIVARAVKRARYLSLIPFTR